MVTWYKTLRIVRVCDHEYNLACIENMVAIAVIYHKYVTILPKKTHKITYTCEGRSLPTQ